MPRILVVDDETDVVSTVKEGLEGKGFQVDTFTDPVEALSNYKPATYDLAIIDIRMPKMTGFELYREIKKKDTRAKVCFFTAFEVYRAEFEKMFPDSDIGGFIRKPVTIAQLITFINAQLERRGKY